MKGFVPTPEPIVDLMVEKLFEQSTPSSNDCILDPGCGTGAFIEGIIRWCNKNNVVLPKIIGVESDPKHVVVAKQKFAEQPQIEIREEDFLIKTQGCYQFIIANPPYIPITKLNENEKATYKILFRTAKERFDLYFLFFEQSLRCLATNGKLVFITPEKFLYVDSAVQLRKLLGEKHIEEIRMVHEETFGDLTTYPTITTIKNSAQAKKTKVILRDGLKKSVSLPSNGVSWLPIIYGLNNEKNSSTLSDFIIRVSCGVATGADAIFVIKTSELNTELCKFAYPTISGRQLIPGKPLCSEDSMLVPYTEDGKIIPENQLGGLRGYLLQSDKLKELKNRPYSNSKPWYALYENPPMIDLLKPKILCKDITAKPYFWIDREGKIVPRHSVYYIVPKNPEDIDLLCKYLNSEEASTWLGANCQRAANGFIRLQSNILRHIPIPKQLISN